MNSTKPAEYIFIKEEGVFKRLNLDEIYFAEAVNNYIKLYAAEYHHMVRTTMEFMNFHLEERGFVRIHRSFTVNLKHILAIGTDSLILDHPKKFELTISKRYMRDLLRSITILDSVSQHAKYEDEDLYEVGEE